MKNNRPNIPVELERDIGVVEKHYNQPEINDSSDESSEGNQLKNNSIYVCNYCEKKI